MSKETEILDHNPIPPTPPPPSSASLVLEGVLFITLGCCSILLGSGIFLLVPIGIYIYLLKKHKEILADKKTWEAVLVAATWLAVPSIPLISFFLFTGQSHIFSPNFVESLAILSIVFLFFFLIGGMIGFLVNGSRTL